LFSARLEPLEDGAEIDLICRKRCKAARSSKPQYRTNAMGPSDHADSRARPCQCDRLWILAIQWVRLLDWHHRRPCSLQRPAWHTTEC